MQPPRLSLLWRGSLTSFALCASYATIVLTQNWLFWGAAPEGQVGVLFDAGLMAQAGISCPGPIAVRMDTPVARYRCSTTGLVFGAFTLNHPIIPWPGYEDGESLALKGIIEATLANASSAPELEVHAIKQ